MSIDHAHDVLSQRRATLASVAGRAHLASLLLNLPDELVGCPVHLLLRACPGIGEIKVKSICMETGTWPLDTVGELGPLKRSSLAHRLTLI